MTQINFAFRAAKEKDMPFLINLRCLTMRAHLETLGIAYDEAAQLQRIMDRFDCAQIVTHDEQDIGLLKIDRAVNPWMFMQIQLAPSFQRKGIGERLVRQVISDAREVGSGVTLKVLKQNPAKKLYEKVGFSAFREDNHSFFMICN